MQGGAAIAPGRPDETGSQGNCGGAFAPTALYTPDRVFQGIGPYNVYMYYTGICAESGNGAPNMNLAISGDGMSFAQYARFNPDGTLVQNPILDPRRGLFDRQVIAPSLLDDTASACRCFRILYEGNDGRVSQIGVGVSTNSIDYDRPEEPVIRNGIFPFMNAGVGDPTWLKDTDGTYKVWFTAVDDEGITSIGYGTSADGGFTWTIQPTPVLARGSSADANFVGEPMVIRDRQGLYRMWYSGGDPQNTRRILYATSTDGVNWSKYGFNGGVVLSLPRDNVLNGNAYDPAVIEDQDGNWYMWFAGAVGDSNPFFLIYYAVNPRPLLNTPNPGDTSLSGKGTPATQAVIQYVDTGQVLGSTTVNQFGDFSVGIGAPLQSGRQVVAIVDGRQSNLIGQAGPTVTPTSAVPTATATPSRQLNLVSVYLPPCTTCASPTATRTPTPVPGQQGTWRPVFSGPFDLRGVSMVSASDGFAVGNGGVSFRGSGGAWSQVNTGTTQNINAVDAVTSTLAVAAANGGNALRWNGASWVGVGPGQPDNFTAVSLNSATDGWIGNAAGQLFRWNGVGFGGASQAVVGIAIRGVQSIAPNVGLAVTGQGDNSIYQWTGAVWQKVTNTPATQQLNAVDGLLGNTGLLSTGYAVGDGGVIMQFSNTTQQWSQIGSPTAFNLNSVALFSATDGFAVGNGGTIIRLNNGTWSLYNSPTTANLHSISIVSSNEAYAVGDGIILRYTFP
jgi:hypothetical protein